MSNPINSVALVPLSDYRIDGTRTYIVRAGSPAITTSVTLILDSIGQELNETFGLELKTIGREPQGFFINTLHILIQDRTGMFVSTYKNLLHSFFNFSCLF